MKSLTKILLLIIISVLVVYLLIWFFSKPAVAPAAEEENELLENIVFCPEKCFYLNQDGSILKEAPELKGSLITIIKSSTPPSQLLNYLLEIKKQFEKQKSIRLMEIELNESSSVITVLTSENWRIIFENSSSSEKIAFLLFNILDKEIKDKRQKLDYIDLRLENRAYYKFK